MECKYHDSIIAEKHIYFLRVRISMLPLFATVFATAETDTTNNTDRSHALYLTLFVYRSSTQTTSYSHNIYSIL